MRGILRAEENWGLLDSRHGVGKRWLSWYEFGGQWEYVSRVLGWWVEKRMVRRLEERRICKPPIRVDGKLLGSR